VYAHDVVKYAAIFPSISLERLKLQTSNLLWRLLSVSTMQKMQNWIKGTWPGLG